MDVKTVWAVYFSGTGTTEQVATCVAKTTAALLGADYRRVCFNEPQMRQRELTFSPEDLVVFGLPVYAGRVPNLLLPYIKEKVRGGGALAVPVVLFGNRAFDDGLMELRNLLRDGEFHPVAAGAFVGEHAFSTILGAGRPDREDMEQAERLGIRAAEKVKVLQGPPEEPVPVEGCEPLRPYYTPQDRHGEPINILKVKPKTDLDLCIGCGLCARLCPMGSIDPQDVSQVPGVCIKCCACVKKCPMGAKYYDDEGYLYHRRELEESYARRAETRIFG